MGKILNYLFGEGIVDPVSQLRYEEHMAQEQRKHRDRMRAINSDTALTDLHSPRPLAKSRPSKAQSKSGAEKRLGEK